MLAYAEVGGKVDKVNLTQFGEAMKRPDHTGVVRMIAAYFPQARGRSERAFATHQGRLPRELALHGIDRYRCGESVSKTILHPCIQCRI